MTTPPIAIEPIPVQVVSPPPSRRKERKTVYRSFPMLTVLASNEGAVLLSPHTPNKIRTLITWTTGAGNTFWIAGSAPDAKGSRGVLVDASVPGSLELFGTDEVWVGLGANNPTVSAIIEYEQD